MIRQLTASELSYTINRLAQANQLTQDKMIEILNQIINLIGSGSGGGLWVDNNNGTITQDNNNAVLINATSKVNNGDFEVNGIYNLYYDNPLLDFTTIIYSGDVAVKNFGIYSGLSEEVYQNDYFAQMALINTDMSGLTFYPLAILQTSCNLFGSDYNKKIMLDGSGTLSISSDLSGVFGSFGSIANFQNGSCYMQAYNNVSQEQGTVTANYNGVGLTVANNATITSTRFDVTPAAFAFTYDSSMGTVGHYFNLIDNGDGNPGVTLNIPIYDNNSDAVSAGLYVGSVYKTNSGEVRIVV
jgi:hypothetical protein